MTSDDMATKQEWLRDQMDQYLAVRHRYETYSSAIKRILEAVAARYAPFAVVQSRPKSLASFAQKAIHKQHEHPDPVHEFTDLCGARIVVHTQDEVKAVCAFIEAHFDIDWDNSVSVEERLKPAEFGYRTVHYIVRLRRGVFPSDDIPVTLSEEELRDVLGLRAEVQVRTLLEHAWAAFTHDRTYKGAFQVPRLWEREIASLAAVLENVDADFSRIHAGLKAYAASYGDYMTPDEIEHEMGMLQIVLERDPENAELASRLGKLAVVAGQWEKAVSVLLPYRHSRYAPALRDLGVAVCKLHRASPESPEYREGQGYLEQAMALDPTDVDTIASLAGTWKGLDDQKVCRLYQQAFEVDPKDPYALGNHLDCQVAQAKSMAPVACLRPLMLDAIRRCQEQAAVGMNMPWAFYSMGKLDLMLGSGHEYDSLAAHAKAVDVSIRDWMIATSLRSLGKLGVVADQLRGYEWARRLLLIGLAANFGDTPDGQSARAELDKLASRGRPAIAGPVAILAGDSAEGHAEEIERWRALVLAAFDGFEGTVIGGGTRSGVSGLVGDLSGRYADAITTIGYAPIPGSLPTEVILDDRYSELRHTDGESFTPLEPLQAWADLIVSGIRPSEVKVLGIGGGEVAAAEYRIALALGAKVAVLRSSGGEAAKLLSDHDWQTAERLIELPADALTVRAFIVKGLPMLPSDIRERIAQAVHETYRRNQTARKRPDDPAMAEWGKLAENLKESNRQQADHLVKLLAGIGCSVHAVTGRDVALMTFSGDEIERMAEMEHARWTAERLSDGWELGQERDVERKVSPHLVPWSELPDDVKEYDRETVREIPKLLAEVGLEIRRAR